MDQPHPSNGGDLAEGIAARIEMAIVTGDLRPGQKLSEQAMSAKFGTSRGPLREAIRSLEARRLLVRRPYAGVRVVDLSPHEIGQLLVVREALEGMAARCAAENMTLPEVRELRSVAEELRAELAGGDVESLYRGGGEHEFHRLVAKGSRNPFLEEAVCRDMFPLLRIIRFRTTAMPRRRPQIGDEHMGILAALERRLPDDAERLMRQHIAHGREALLRTLDGDLRAPRRR